jgi:hypothetical protein
MKILPAWRNPLIHLCTLRVVHSQQQRGIPLRGQKESLPVAKRGFLLAAESVHLSANEGIPFWPLGGTPPGRRYPSGGTNSAADGRFPPQNLADIRVSPGVPVANGRLEGFPSSRQGYTLLAEKVSSLPAERFPFQSTTYIKPFQPVPPVI